MKIAICAGKTGGHFFPALAVARLLKSQTNPWEIFFIGTKGGLDETLLQKEGFQFESISGCGLPQKINLGVFKWVFSLILSLAQMQKIFKKRKPDILLSFGGYISVAPVLIARWMKIPVVIHEANIHPGRANRFLARWAQAICTTFPMTECSSRRQNLKSKTLCKERHHLTGLPLRPNFLQVTREQALKDLGLDPEKFIILVMGGSLGSKRINDCLLDTVHQLGAFTEKVQILHITGQKDYERIKASYHHTTSRTVKDGSDNVGPASRLNERWCDHPNGVSYQIYAFMENVERAFKCANLFIGRAGASTIAEITYCGLPSILIPYPYAIENHQEINATYLGDKGATCMLKETDLSPEVLTKEIVRFIENQNFYQTMSQRSKELGISDGTQRIVKVLKQVLS